MYFNLELIFLMLHFFRLLPNKKLYAKQKKFKEAIREWEKALALNPACQKAHNYIAKAKSAEASLPVIKWVKVTASALAASLIIVVVLLFYLLRVTTLEG